MTNTADDIINKLKEIIGKVTDEEKKQMLELKELENDSKGVVPEIVQIDRDKFIKGIQPVLYHKEMLCCAGGFPALIENFENNKDFKIVHVDPPIEGTKEWWITFKALNTDAMQMIKKRYIDSRLNTRITIDMYPLYTKEEKIWYKDRKSGSLPIKHLLSNMRLLTSYVPHKRDPIFTKCWHCNEMKAFKKCSQCTTARYCSKNCQKKDWSNHKKICSRKLQNTSAEQSPKFPLGPNENPSPSGS